MGNKDSDWSFLTFIKRRNKTKDGISETEGKKKIEEHILKYLIHGLPFSASNPCERMLLMAEQEHDHKYINS